MRKIERLLALLRRVPLLAIDEAAARARGDHAALEYARALRQWQIEAERIAAEIDEEPAHRPSAFERILAAADRPRLPASTTSDAALVPA